MAAIEHVADFEAKALDRKYRVEVAVEVATGQCAVLALCASAAIGLESSRQLRVGVNELCAVHGGAGKRHYHERQLAQGLIRDNHW